MKSWLRQLIVLAAASPLAAQSNQKPRLVIIGGGLDDDNRAVYEEIVRGREGSGPLCVVPTATAAAGAEGSTKNAVATISRYSGGIPVVGVILTTANAKDADSPELAARLRQCSGYFFTGGVQSRIVQVFRPEGRRTGAFDALMDRFRQGAVISGSSAGAGMVSDPMIAGGSSAGALRNGVQRDTGSAGVSIEPGMGFFTTAIVDQHFLARGRIARLIVAVLQINEYKVGFGIDENTALVVGETDAWVAGASSVALIDARAARRQDGGHGGTGLRFALLSSGDRYRLQDGRITFDTAKPPIAQTGAAPTAPADLFSRRAFQRWVLEVTRSADRAGAIIAEGYRLTLRPLPDFTARAAGAPDQVTAFSAGPWRLDLLRN
jgi:cyanophycinase